MKRSISDSLWNDYTRSQDTVQSTWAQQYRERRKNKFAFESAHYGNLDKWKRTQELAKSRFITFKNREKGGKKHYHLPRLPSPFAKKTSGAGKIDLSDTQPVHLPPI